MNKKRIPTSTVIVFLFLGLIISALVVGINNFRQVRENMSLLKQGLEEINSDLTLLQQKQDLIQWDLDSIDEFVKYSKSKELKVCAPASTFKSFMDYRAITSPSSKQYALLQKGFDVSHEGILVQDDRYLVAMGPEYGPVGTDLIIELKNYTLKVRIGDIKHTGCTSKDGSMLEFIVDTPQLPKSIRISGNFNDIFEGRIEYITYDDKK